MSLEEATTAVVPSPGAMLRQARERANLSKEDVAAKLKLSVRQIAAIETGDWSVLPERTFTRGFMRSYARLVSLDPDSLGLDQSSSQPHAATELKPTPEAIGVIAYEAERNASGIARWVVPAALIAVLVAGIAYVQWGHLISFAGFKSGAAATGTPAAGKSATSATASKAADTSSATSSGAVIAPTPAAASAASPTVVEGAAAPSLTPSTALPVMPSSGAAPADTPAKAPLLPPLAAGEKRITLSFKGKSWTEVRSKGEVIFSETAQPGTREFAGAPPLSFTVGNASNVSISIDGKPYDMSDITRNDVARFRIE